MNEDVECLKNRVRDLDQYFRKTNIEISGILVMAKEDINSLTKDIGAVIGQKIEEVQAMAAQGVRATTAAEIRHWFYKAKKTIVTNQVNPTFPKRQVYINEYLKQFLRKLRLQCKRSRH